MTMASKTVLPKIINLYESMGCKGMKGSRNQHGPGAGSWRVMPTPAPHKKLVSKPALVA